MFTNVGSDIILILLSSMYSNTYGYLFTELGALIIELNISFLSVGQFFVTFSIGFLYVYLCVSGVYVV